MYRSVESNCLVSLQSFSMAEVPFHPSSTSSVGVGVREEVGARRGGGGSLAGENFCSPPGPPSLQGKFSGKEEGGGGGGEKGWRRLLLEHHSDGKGQWGTDQLPLKLYPRRISAKWMQFGEKKRFGTKKPSPERSSGTKNTRSLLNSSSSSKFFGAKKEAGRKGRRLVVVVEEEEEAPTKFLLFPAFSKRDASLRLYSGKIWEMRRKGRRRRVNKLTCMEKRREERKRARSGLAGKESVQSFWFRFRL